MKTLVLLDFDGTVYRGDSLRDFARYLNPKKYRKSLLSIAWMLPFSMLSTRMRTRMKVRFLHFNFSGIPLLTLEEKGRTFYETHKDRIFPRALVWLQQVERETQDVYLLSASCHAWLRPFAEAWNVGLICTTLGVEGGICTGGIVGANLRGKEKVRAVREHCNLGQYSTVVAFGNERADWVLKEIAQRVEIHYFR